MQIPEGPILEVTLPSGQRAYICSPSTKGRIECGRHFCHPDPRLAYTFSTHNIAAYYAHLRDGRVINDPTLAVLLYLTTQPRNHHTQE